MKENNNKNYGQVKEKRLSLPIIFFTFAALAVLTSIPMIILGSYIDHEQIPKGYVIVITAYWLLTAIGFTFLTSYQINHRYENPMRQFAQATKQVANGDFSVYIKPRHTIEKMDYLDAMFLDFNKMVEELGSIETLKTDFVSSVSHEIKTPLAIIQNYAEALEKDNLTQEQRKEYIETILHAVKRLSSLIMNILKLNKLEKQTISPITEPYDVCRQLCECALSFEHIWENKNIEFIVDVEDMATIETDENLMELVWNNLLSNAIKFTDSGGTIILKQTSSESEVIISVSDNGCGMSEETMKHLFDKFYQGDLSHSTEGNGLGLSLVLRILELLEGRITAASTLGEGSVFTVSIPTTKGR